MKTTEQKLIALLERMGWTWWVHSISQEVIFAKGVPLLHWKSVESPENAESHRYLPKITHALTDEVWEWMKDNETTAMAYNKALKELVDELYDESEATVFTAHLTPHQKFDAACKALGIE